MLGYLDRKVRFWHVALASGLAIGWYIGLALLTARALPTFSFFRCPIGFCALGYTANSISLTMRLIGAEGREFLHGVLMPLDRLHPLLLLAAISLGYVWLTRPTDIGSVKMEGRLRYMLLGVPLLYALADWGENWAFDRILAEYPQIRYPSVMRASILTALKSQLFAAALGFGVALGLAAYLRWHGWVRAVEPRPE